MFNLNILVLDLVKKWDILLLINKTKHVKNVTEIVTLVKKQLQTCVPLVNKIYYFIFTIV